MPIGQPKAAIRPTVGDVLGGRPRVEAVGTEQLADAFYKGVVTTDDIINRIDARARAKRDAEKQYYEEQLSPEAQQARQAVREAEKLQAQEQAQKATTELELGDVSKKIRRNEQLWKLSNSQAGGTLDTMQAAFTMAGTTMPMKMDEAGNVMPDVEAARAKFRDVQEYAAFQKDLTNRFEGIQQQEFEDETGGKTINWVDKNELSTPQEAGALRDRLKPLAGLTFDQWKALNRPRTVGTLFGMAPGQATAPAAGVPAAGVPAAGAPVPTPAPTGGAPEAIPAGARAPGGGIVVKAGSTGGKMGTEVQTRAQGALARMGESNDLTDELERRGFDPGSIWTWTGAMLPELLKPENVKMFESAKELWTAGVLRYESGAALTKHEEEWYKGTFFPRVGDPPSVIRAKARARSDLETVIADTANKGGAGSPRLQAMAEEVYRRAAAISGWSGEKGVVSPESRGWQRFFNEQGETVWYDPKSQRYYQPKVAAAENPAAPAAESLVQPTGTFYMGPNPEAAPPVVEPVGQPKFVSSSWTPEVTPDLAAMRATNQPASNLVEPIGPKPPLTGR